MSETALKKKALAHIKTLPFTWCWKVADKFTSFIPDIVGVSKGYFWAIELKVGYNKPTPGQKCILRKIASCWGRVAVCYTIEEVKEFMQKVTNNMWSGKDRQNILDKYSI